MFDAEVNPCHCLQRKSYEWISKKGWCTLFVALDVRHFVPLEKPQTLFLFLIHTHFVYIKLQKKINWVPPLYICFTVPPGAKRTTCLYLGK